MKTRSVRFLLHACLCLGIWLSLGLLSHLAARAGGAGGRSSGRSSGGGSHGGSSFGRSSSYHGSRGTGVSSGNNSFNSVIFFIILAVVAYIIIQNVRKSLSNKQDDSGVIAYPPEPDSSAIRAFLADHPDFDVAAFNSKVSAAFLKIQAAWTAQDIAPIRQFISDGMYQRFATQFRMMGLLKQHNRLDQIRLLGVEPVSARVDGIFDVIDVKVDAAMHDSFVCELDPSLDTESDESFREYWSFIRKRGATEAGFNVFTDKTCPSCGAELPRDMGELCRCAYCQVMVNSGDFDWILAEITQQADYGDRSRLSRFVSPELPQAIAAIAPECPDFSSQLAEDKASNAFMQIMTSVATRNPASVRRFVSDELFETFTTMIPERHIVFNRIYLNESVLLDVSRAGPIHRLTIGLSASMQRVELRQDGGIDPCDAREIRSGHVLTLERDADAVPEKGSLYQHQCATCGGAVGDTLDVKCQYCGTALNSTRNEWIVCGFSPLEGDSP